MGEYESRKWKSESGERKKKSERVRCSRLTYFNCISGNRSKDVRVDGAVEVGGDFRRSRR